jgi:hypothetical protein
MCNWVVSIHVSFLPSRPRRTPLPAGVFCLAVRSILFGCNVFIPAEHLAGFGYPDAVFAGSNDALIIF